MHGLVSSLLPYNHSNINHLLPSDFTKTQTSGIMFIFSCYASDIFTGGSLGNLHFMWPVPQQHDDDVATYFKKSQSVVERTRPTLPTFHTRMMREITFQKFGRISPIKPSVLRFFYKELTGMCILDCINAIDLIIIIRR